jgi:plastocyanin
MPTALRRTAAAAAALGTLVLASACGGSSGTAHGGTPAATRPGATVDMVFTDFKPATVSITAGQAVTFVNDNPITHVVVEGSYTLDSSMLRTQERDDGVFDLKVAQKGDVVSHTFTEPGTYQFFCTIHKGMNGTVTVR